MKKAIVLGCTGMVGGCFTQRLADLGWDVTGVARHTALGRHVPAHPYAFVGCDILDRENLEAVFRRVRPDLVVHMAAQAFNSVSWDSERYTYLANVEGTLNVVSALRAAAPEAQLVLACSSAEYGDGANPAGPTAEEAPLRPITPYGVTKVAVECMGHQHFRNHGLRVYLPRMFIQVGTGHPPATAIQNFARQVALIKAGLAEPVVRTGRLDTRRDFLDVRDGVEGILAMLERGEPGEPVNVCSGEAPTVGEALHELLEIAGVEVRIERDPALLRPTDETLLVGDNARLRALGWTRRHPLRETLEGVLDDWMRRVAAR